jgi:hypothetical protein
LLWFVKKEQIPPLVTIGSAYDFVSGGLGQPGTQPLIGPGPAKGNEHNGGRVTGLFWFDDPHTWGVDGSLFGLEQRTPHMTASSAGRVGDLVLSRPFFNAVTYTQDADPVALTNVQSGNVFIIMPRRFYGADANFRWAFGDASNGGHLSWMVGPRFLTLDEKLEIAETTFDLPGIGNWGNVTNIKDSFTTYNRFYGGQFGAEAEFKVGYMDFTVMSKVGCGQNVSVIKVEGSTQLLDGTSGQLFIDGTRGLLAGPTNIGRFRKNNFSVMNESSVTLGFDLNGYVRALVGYNLIYWSKVLRPSDQIDTALNLEPLTPGQFQGPARPAIPFKSSDFWVQGISFGFQVSY